MRHAFYSIRIVVRDDRMHMQSLQWLTMACRSVKPFSNARNQFSSPLLLHLRKYRMLVLKKRPLISKPRQTSAASDSDDESDDCPTDDALPVVPANFKIPWRKEKSKDTSGSFFFVDNVGSNVEASSEPVSVLTDEVVETSTVAKKPDPVVVDESIQKLLDKAVCGPSFEKNYAGTAKLIGTRAAKRLRKLEREKTKGRDWFDLPATELTDEAKADLELLQMRSAIDPLAFYRRNDRSVLPKYFQVGRVVDAPEDFYSSRMTRKERKRTMLDELLYNEAFVQSKREKFKAIQDRERKKRRGAFQQSRTHRSRKDKPNSRKKKV
ncbi:hypothetical protein KIN20_009106 [Parelaphostrongylus tenuis]|uniref:Fcf2 pre-rRNA processing C-terminal domain-containing protein n=1 Tax=Parelaphostrongylus tenuis TaxID=148309 RepID=A0AAD5QKD1_PARTN|nr:hypothetical protein KIN20_009106 [Parelaphostrongylus tenuis]